jgi:hypothetical protein
LRALNGTYRKGGEMKTGITIENLDKVLEHKNITNISYGKYGDEFIERIREFDVEGMHIKIIWFCNESNVELYDGKIIIPFVDVEQSNTWPNRGKMNLQFYDSGGEVCLIIKIEDWEEK